MKYRIWDLKEQAELIDERASLNRDGKVIIANTLFGAGEMPKHLKADLFLGICDKDARPLYENDWVALYDGEKIYQAKRLELDKSLGICLCEGDEAVLPLRVVGFKLEFIGSHDKGKAKAEELNQEIRANWQKLYQNS